MTAPTAILNEGRDGLTVEFDWSALGVDRPRTYSILVGTAALAARVIRATEAGVLFSAPIIATDVNGKTYVQADCKVLGRRLNADLRALGF